MSVFIVGDGSVAVAYPDGDVDYDLDSIDVKVDGKVIASQCIVENPKSEAEQLARSYQAVWDTAKRSAFRERLQEERSARARHLGY